MFSLRICAVKQIVNFSLLRIKCREIHKFNATPPKLKYKHITMLPRHLYIGKASDFSHIHVNFRVSILMILFYISNSKLNETLVLSFIFTISNLKLPGLLYNPQSSISRSVFLLKQKCFSALPQGICPVGLYELGDASRTLGIQLEKLKNFILRLKKSRRNTFASKHSLAFYGDQEGVPKKKKIKLFILDTIFAQPWREDLCIAAR